jgi:DNA-directed RNA polymerase I subunit RPA1
LLSQFTGNSQKLLLIDVIERCCRKAVIHEVQAIGRCMKIFNDKGEFTVRVHISEKTEAILM